MDETLQMADLIASSWKVILTFLLCALFGSVAIIKAYEVLATKFGWESKTEKRFKELEKRVADLEKSAQTFYDNRVHDREQSRQIQHEILDSLDAIQHKLDKKDNLDFKKLRNQIVQIGEDAIEKGNISIRKLKSLEELYSEYTDTYGGNSYAATLMTKVRLLPVIGKLNEHGEDIE